MIPLETVETRLFLGDIFQNPLHPIPHTFSTGCRTGLNLPDPILKRWGVSAYEIFGAILYLDSMKTEALGYLSGGCGSYQVLFIRINQNWDIDKLLLSQELLKTKLFIWFVCWQYWHFSLAVPAEFHQTSWYQQSLSRISKCQYCRSSFSSMV